MLLEEKLVLFRNELKNKIIYNKNKLSVESLFFIAFSKVRITKLLAIVHRQVVVFWLRNRS